MRYATVDGKKEEPKPGLKGTCPSCGAGVQAKCGSLKAHHWAHVRLQDCDPWNEGLTQWHIDWQNQFPQEWQERTFHDPNLNCHHRADVQTPKGVTIEFQNSPISTEELASREAFYEKLIWVVNAKRFEQSFHVNKAILNPSHQALAEFEFGADGDGLSQHVLLVKKSDIEELRASGAASGVVRIYGMNDPELKAAALALSSSTALYCLFTWKHKHRTWLQAKAPVFFDFGDAFLWQLLSREQTRNPLRYLRCHKKSEFIAKYLN